MKHLDRSGGAKKEIGVAGFLSYDINHGVVAYLAPPIFNSAQRKAKRNVGFPDKVDFKSCKGDLRFKPSLQDLNLFV